VTLDKARRSGCCESDKKTPAVRGVAQRGRKFKTRETVEFSIGYLQFDAPILSGMITD
jgi:hypothetical protein